MTCVPAPRRAKARALQHPRAFARGFTLVELIAVLAIISLLLVMSWPLAELAARRQREDELRRDLWELRDAIDAYKRMADAGMLRDATRSGYPPDLQLLVTGVPTATMGTAYLLRRLPQDPFMPDAPDGGWALRSYRSPPDRPEAGEDVFDVHSRAPGAGLNGVPLGQW
jgi:general secretion pathway protein G